MGYGSAREQGGVALRMGHDVLTGVRQDELAITPHSRGAVRAIGAAGREQRPEVGTVAGRSRMGDFEQPAAGGAAGSGVGVRRLPPASSTSLPARGDGIEGRHASTSTRAPTRSISQTRTRLSIAWAANADSMATATACAHSIDDAKANVVGPAPDIDAPNAPAASAAAFASRKPGINGARTGSAMRSSIARPRRARSPDASAATIAPTWAT